MLEGFVDANVENLKATCNAPWDVKDFSAMAPESFSNGRRFVDRARIQNMLAGYLKKTDSKLTPSSTETLVHPSKRSSAPCRQRWSQPEKLLEQHGRFTFLSTKISKFR